MRGASIAIALSCACACELFGGIVERSSANTTDAGAPGGSTSAGGASGAGASGAAAGTSGTGGSAGAGDGGVLGPASCAPGGDGMTNCGPGATESCCKTLPVPGGTFLRGYDGDTYTDDTHPATLSGYQLDAYEVTVGRFRQFVSAVDAGWVPAPGSGKHVHVNDGNGLAAAAGGYEPGWMSSWASELPTTKTEWDSELACSSTYPIWTPAAGSNETRPINCVTWYDAYAFCTWDGGFLPSEAEWNFAAAGGSEQRLYPWGSQVPGPNANLAIYGCYFNGSGTCYGVENIAPVGSAPLGNGLWGQSDLAGNLSEWALDWHQPDYPDPCVDCFQSVPDGQVRRIRIGAGFSNDASFLLSARRGVSPPGYRYAFSTIRCARSP